MLENAGRELEDDATKCFHSSGRPFAINRPQALSEFLETDHLSFFSLPYLKIQSVTTIHIKLQINMWDP